MFALVDCNNFYASCERVFRPDLNGKPVVILSNNDGCVIARSNEAKALDIPMGAPAFKFAEVFKQNSVNVFSSNFALYGDMSARIMNILSEIAPEIEIYSIDEAFLKFTGFQNYDLNNYGLMILKKILKYTGIPVSVGFAPTKALSKVAVHVAKKFPERTKGVYVIDNDKKRIKALNWLQIDDVWGIGRKHAERLKNVGVFSALRFTETSDSWIKKHMSVIGLRLKNELLGKSTLDLDKVENKKSIATTRTFEKNYTDFELIKERVVTFAVTCSEKLRKQKSNCNSIMIFLHTNWYRKDLPQISPNIVIQLPYPTNSAIEIAKFAVKGLNQIFKEGYLYKKAGVVVMNFTPENPQQLSIFENSNPKHKKLMKTIDYINNNIGAKKLKLAAQDLDRTWKMNQEKLSPRYTTKIDEILKIKTD